MDRGAWQATVHGVAKSQTHTEQLTHILPCAHLAAEETRAEKFTEQRRSVMGQRNHQLGSN